MKAVIHQPQYFPYPGFFHKLSMADVYIIMDNTQYDKRYTNRNRIITPTGYTWITVPINKDHKFYPNKEVEINNNISWEEEHWNKIFFSYKNSKFFNLYNDYFNQLYKKKWLYLFELNFETIKKTIEWLDIKVDIIKESELNIDGKGTERLVNICKAVGAETYISGRGLPGKKYLDEKIFEKNNIKLSYQQYKSVKYEQHLSKEFVPDLSIIDLLFNEGHNSQNIIKINYA